MVGSSGKGRDIGGIRQGVREGRRRWKSEGGKVPG